MVPRDPEFGTERVCKACSERERAGEDSRVQSAPHRPGLRGIKGGQNIPVSEVPAVQERGILEEVAGVVEEEGDFKDCLGEVGAGPGQGGVLGDHKVPHEELWEGETREGESPAPRVEEGGDVPAGRAASPRPELLTVTVMVARGDPAGLRTQRYMAPS